MAIAISSWNSSLQAYGMWTCTEQSSVRQAAVLHLTTRAAYCRASIPCTQHSEMLLEFSLDIVSHAQACANQQLCTDVDFIEACRGPQEKGREQLGVTCTMPVVFLHAGQWNWFFFRLATAKSPQLSHTCTL